ncbi:MAG: hypothetical protein NVSMB65_05110 [Chloroflexota bacterium]
MRVAVARRALAPLALLVGATLPHSPGPSGPALAAEHSPRAATAAVDHLLAAMTLHQKVGQLFMVAFGGAWLTSTVADRLARAQPGAVILFGENIGTPTDLRLLTASLQQTALRGSHVPLVVATDQEGGAVNRVTTGVPLYPANGYWGSLGPGAAEQVRAAARATGAGLRALGINMDLAPVVDVVTNPCNTVIGSRSFGADPALVARLGAAAVQGYHEGGVLAVAKHFPGYDDTCTDAHGALPTLRTSPHQLATVDLPPFQAAIDRGVDSVMLGHLVVRELDPSGLPATLSPAIIEGVLRSRLHFGGVVLTDDLAMGAITSLYSLPEACVRALRAGVDMVMLTSLLDDSVATMAAVEGAVRHGDIPLSRVDDAVRHILTMKQRAGLLAEGRAGLLTRALRERAPVTPAPKAPAPMAPAPMARAPITRVAVPPLAVPEAPAAPVGSAPAIGRLRWDLPAAPQHTAYYSLAVWYYTGGTLVPVTLLRRLDAAVYHSITVDVPVAGALYYARIRAYNVAGMPSGPSASVTVRARFAVPATPARLSVVLPGPEAALWRWAGASAPTTYRATLYHYEGTRAVVDRVATLGAPGWRTEGLGTLGPRGGTVYLRVVALNPDGLASTAATASAWILPRALPVVVPTPLESLERGPTELLWRWPVQAHAFSYRVRLTHRDADRTVVDQDLRLDGGQTTLRTSSLWPGTRYTLTVWAISNVGRPSAPAMLEVATVPMAPLPPRDPHLPRPLTGASAGGTGA